MPDPSNIARVKTIVRSALRLSPTAELGDDMALAGGEYDVDSLDILLIVTELEKEFHFQVAEGALTRSAFASIAALVAFVEASTGARG
ncbi:hypothetical protein BH11PLA1_BH11PLA1_00780 [soil metagenome]